MGHSNEINTCQLRDMAPWVMSSRRQYQSTMDVLLSMPHAVLLWSPLRTGADVGRRFFPSLMMMSRCGIRYLALFVSSALRFELFRRRGSFSHLVLPMRP